MSVPPLRQRLSNLTNFDQLVYKAILGEWSNDGTGLPPVSYKVVFADSGVLAASTEADIWPYSATADMPVPTNAETLNCVSSSVNDDVGGSGTSGIFIEGLDDNYEPISEFVLLDGTTPVTTTNTYRHVWETNCVNVGSTGTTNAGNITLTNSSSSQVLSYVAAGDSLSKHSQFLVPAGYNAIMLGGNYSIYRSSGTGTRRARIDLELIPADGGGGTGIEYRSLKLGGTSEGALSNLTFTLPLVVGSRVLIKPKATAEANNTQVSVDYGIVLVKDTVDIDSVL